MTTKRHVEVRRELEVPPARVFDAWLDPSTAGRWLFATPTGRMVRVDIDPRAGGRYAIVERRDGEDVLHEGEYLAVERPSRLAFTLHVPKYSAESDVITVELTPRATGCTLTLSQDTAPEWADSTAEGWRGILEGLAATLAR